MPAGSDLEDSPATVTSKTAMPPESIEDSDSVEDVVPKRLVFYDTDDSALKALGVPSECLRVKCDGPGCGLKSFRLMYKKDDAGLETLHYFRCRKCKRCYTPTPCEIRQSLAQ
jgi:hypothetical protein